MRGRRWRRLRLGFGAIRQAELRVVGVTGTNGKTTTAFLIREVLEAAGIQCGLLGTVRQVVGGAEEEVERTTPEAIDLQATFRRMLEAGDRACVMEVSSHALALHRADAIHFEVALFTNLTQDHLDFHERHGGLLRRQAAALRDGAEGLDRQCRRPLRSAPSRRIRLHHVLGRGRQRRTSSARNVTFDATAPSFIATHPPTGLERDYASRSRPVGGEVAVRTGLPGHFNVANALGAFAAATALGVSPELAAEGLARAERVPGRFEPID